VSASAALTGLIFVAVSINLRQIVGQDNLISRSAKALFTLAGMLVMSTLCLVPSHRPLVLGMELIVLGTVLWLSTTRAQWLAAHQNPYGSRGQRLLHFLLTQASSIPVLVAGGSLVVGVGGGLYWLVAAAVFSLVAALIDAWVLLIEIQR